MIMMTSLSSYSTISKYNLWRNKSLGVIIDEGDGRFTPKKSATPLKESFGFKGIPSKISKNPTILKKLVRFFE